MQIIPAVGAPSDLWRLCQPKWSQAKFPFSYEQPATPFSPSTLPGLTTWTKADAGTYTTSALNIPATTDGARVGGWVPQGGTSGNWLQLTLSSRPTLKTNVQNSLPVVRWGAEGGVLLLSSAIANIGDFYLIFAGNIKDKDNIAFGDSTSTGFFLQNISTNGRVWELKPGSGNPQSNPYGCEENKFCIYEVHRSGSAISFYRDGLLMSSGATGSNTFNFGEIGGYNGGQFPSLMDLGEVIFGTSAMSTTNQLATEYYLKIRWGTR